MAIIIPSKSIYKKQNQKVLDNIIERIEVGAIEVLPDNEYETPVFNQKVLATTENITYPTVEKNSEVNGNHKTTIAEGMWSVYTSASYAGFVDKQSLNVEVKIPIVKDNKRINKIFTKTDKNDEENIKYIVYGITEFGTATANWSYTRNNFSLSIEEGAINYNPPTITSETEQILSFPENLQIVENQNIGAVSSSAEQNLKLWGNIKTADIIPTATEYILNLEIPVGLTTVIMKYYNFVNGSGTTANPPSTIDLSGWYEKFIPKQVEITIYGNTIGIDLTDKTVYINGETAKKVQSFEGNELMQTSNYRKSEIKIKIIDTAVGKAYFEVLEGNVVENDILYEKGTQKRMTVKKDERGFYLSGNISGYFYVDQEVICERTIGHLLGAFTLTAENYAKGKETATILCSIADYYESETGEKVIAIDNSTKKMTFDIGDEVVPMVYGFDKIDVPMSMLKENKAKVFKVLGINPYYDGAVWQKLSLQENGTIDYEQRNKTLKDLSNYTLLSLAEKKLVTI